MAASPNLNDETTAPSRYVVGIDLGTTNSAVAYVDTTDLKWRVQTFAVPQLVAPGMVEARETLPSFHYQAAEGEFAPNALRLSWSSEEPNFVTGFFARDHGETVPGRLINSAKSWLCHPGVDRTADLLPWHGAPDVDRLSPVEVSARYLAHIRGAWNARFPQEPLESQDVVLTLPASFDEVARELTVAAAKRAGLPRVVLIEEPQAAFYAWIHAQGDDWERAVQPGQKILVCDIGGGTSDFTLIRVRNLRGEKNADGSTAADRVQFHRVAVGEHLILGGDNLDLALAHHLESRLSGQGKLEPRQWSVLVRSCRQVKETLLGTSPPERLVVNLPGSGSRMIGGGLQIEVTRDEAQQVLVDGFLPRVALDEKPIARRSGFQEFGLPYAPDAAITRYLAAFLTAHRHVALDETVSQDAALDPARPDLVLFNGGLFESPVLRQRLLDVLGSWFNAPAWQPVVLDNDRLDLAVARGAAYYGMVRRGVGVRIAAGLARSYYIGVDLKDESKESASQEVAATDAPTASALCLLPAGVEEGQEIELAGEHKFNLRIREPVEFPLFVSSTRLTDPAGTLTPVDPTQMSALPPLRTVLQTSKKGTADTVPVHLHARLTEIGTLDLWCSEVDTERRWRLQFDVRAATQTDKSVHLGAGESQGFVDDAVLEACREQILAAFGLDRAAGEKPEALVKRIEAASQMSRREWPSSLLRGFWETLIETDDGRKKSSTHEARWLYLLGFSLRPGYGMAVDDWRVAQTWRLLQGRRFHHDSVCRAEWWILWRRIAGGLNSGQQRSLAEPFLATLRPLAASRARGKQSRKIDFGFGSHETAEVWRLLGSLELLSVATKVELGDLLLDLAPREKVGAIRDACVWALGRLGARVPMYGPLNTVVPVDVVSRWTRALLKLGDANLLFSVVTMSRRTGDRYRDLSAELRESMLGWLDRIEAPAHYVELVREGGQLDEAEQGIMFGESLPRGLRLG
jgi:molecular chaperone DnaK (HSP70)